MNKLGKAGLSVLLLASLSFFSACTITKPEEKSRTIMVNGSASVEIPSDLEVVQFTVVTSGWSARQIVQDNDTITQRFVNAVKDIGVSEGDIELTECVITNPNNYEARRNVKIKVRNMALAPAIVDCKSGLIKLVSMKFETVDTASEVRRVRTLAVQNAQDSAGLIAGASGCKLGEVVEIVSDEVSQTKTDDHKLMLTAKVSIKYDLQ